MSVKAWGGVLVGVLIATIIPVAFRIFAQLLEDGVVQFVRDGSTMQTLTAIALGEVLLGPIGIVIAGRSAGLHGPGQWLASMIVAVPVLAFIWFICAATLSGALGSPL